MSELGGKRRIVNYNRHKVPGKDGVHVDHTYEVRMSENYHSTGSGQVKQGR